MIRTTRPARLNRRAVFDSACAYFSLIAVREDRGTGCGLQSNSAVPSAREGIAVNWSALCNPHRRVEEHPRWCWGLVVTKAQPANHCHRRNGLTRKIAYVLYRRARHSDAVRDDVAEIDHVHQPGTVRRAQSRSHARLSVGRRIRRLSDAARDAQLEHVVRRQASAGGRSSSGRDCDLQSRSVVAS